MAKATVSELSKMCWSVADLLRGDFRQHQYGGIILPLTVLRRLDCVIAPTKRAVVKKHAELEASGIENFDAVLRRTAKLNYYNVCPLDFPGLLADPDQLAANLRQYIEGFSPGAVDVLDRYNFDATITLLADRGLLYKVVGQFASLDLHPDRVPNELMGYVFEDLIRRFAEVSNETAGDHFTPREVIRLMVNLLLAEDDELLTQPGIVRTMYDGAAGTGGMLSAAYEYVHELNPKGTLKLYGQELNPESYAICRSDMLMKGLDPSNIAFGNSLTDEDGHAGKTFSYQLANPPFGVEWKKYAEQIRDEHARGDAGRYAPGLPRITDGSLLFLMNMVSKMAPAKSGGGRMAIVFNGSPLFSGGAGSSESEIRRWVLENDLLEGVVALPDQLFYNTGISTYFWILSNRKPPQMQGKVVLLDARDQFEKMPRSLGDKRKLIPEESIRRISQWYGDSLGIVSDETHPAHSKLKVVETTSFGYLRIPIDQPLQVRYEVTRESIDAVLSDAKVAKTVTPDLANELNQALDTLVGKRTFDLTEFEGWLAGTLASAGADLEAATRSKAVRKAISAASTIRDPDAPPALDTKGRLRPDPQLRDYENLPLDRTVEDYLATEVLPHAPGAWADTSKATVGYEIPFTRLFFQSATLRPLAEVDADLRAAEEALRLLLAKVTRL